MMLPDKTIPVKTSIMVVYENGVFRPMESVEGLYQEGDEVSFLVSNPAALKQLLDSIIEPYPAPTESLLEEDEDALQAEIDKLAQGVTLSDAIIEERHGE